MTMWHRKSKRKITGGFRVAHRKARKRERGRDYIPTEIEKRKLKQIRKTGGGTKKRLLSAQTANITDGKKMRKAKIIRVIENPANIHFVRMNVLTKGAVIETELGKAVVTSRPGQNGIVNAKLIEEKKD